MIAFWGEPGNQEPSIDTPMTFLGVDGRWRKLAKSDFGPDIGYLSIGMGTLSPDGSRWVTAFGAWNEMINFQTGRHIKLTHDPFLKYTSWSPDSRAVALWRQPGPGDVEVFNRMGDRIADVPIGDLKDKNISMPDARHLTAFDYPPRHPGRRVRGHQLPERSITYTKYDLHGAPVQKQCVNLPAGYRLKDTGIDFYDGHLLGINALIDAERGIYRHSVIDTETGEVVDDVENAGYTRYLSQRVEPGVYMAGLAGGPNGIFVADPSTGQLDRLSWTEPYRHQDGYSNHPYDQFATDLIFR